MTRIYVAASLWLALWLAAPSVMLAQTWPNAPSGATTILDCPMTSLASCGMYDVYGTSIQSTDATAPISPSGVIRSRLAALATGGGMQIGKNFAATRELFMGLMWRTNPEFQGRIVGNKTFFLGSSAGAGVFLFGRSALSNGSAPLIYNHNSSLDNSHICSDGGIMCYPNVSSGTVTRGNWTKIEVYVRASTTRTSRDGILRWWINGVLAGNYTTFNFHSPSFSDWIWTETWDGSGDMGTSNTVEWNHYIDHLYLSAPSGGIIPQPPIDNPPGPPGTVTGVTVTVQ